MHITVAETFFYFISEKPRVKRQRIQTPDFTPEIADDITPVVYAPISQNLSPESHSEKTDRVNTCFLFDQSKDLVNKGI